MLLLTVSALLFLMQVDQPMPLDGLDIAILATALAAQQGWAAFVAMLVNALKLIPGLVSDGNADRWATGLNLLGLAGLFAVVVFVPDFDVTSADTMLGTIAQIGGLLLGLAGQIATSRALHQKFLRGAPLLGTTYSGKAPGKA